MVIVAVPKRVKWTTFSRKIGAIAIASTIATATLTGVAAPAFAGAGTNNLQQNEQLNPGQRLVTSNGIELIMQGDGNLVEYAPGRGAIWASGTNRPGSVLRMQGDGNLVIIAPGNVPTWSTRTAGYHGAGLELQTDGNAVVYAQGHVAKWANGVQLGALDRNNIAQVKEKGRQMMREAGFVDSEWTCLNNLWTKESGWRWNATNRSSGAYGIPQAANPASKMSSAGADWRDNPVTQIRWGLDYIKSRYGSPCGAWNHSKARGWY